jgi:hypothetical protein
MKLLAVKKSTKKDKKLMAIFCKCDGETKCPPDERQTIHFGQKGADDYTLTKDKDQRDRYRKRNVKQKDQEANTAGALAYHILWGETTSRKENIKLFKQKYNV